MEIKVLKGTKDILSPEIEKWIYIEQVARKICQLYGYKEIRTPVFEYADLFIRSVGQTTDIVEKQMYIFKDRADRILALRPEGTAPIVRAYLEHKMYAQPLPVKLYYIASMYRYERPQAGRYREFYQIGLEAIGMKNPSLDAELISLLNLFFKELDIKNLKYKINSLGCLECRKQFIKHLTGALKNSISLFCENCNRRYTTNPLRILDCKECRTNIEKLPNISNYLCESCKKYFENVLKFLQDLEIDYVLDPYLVRGLDYYTGTIFEVISDKLGSQNAVAGGGRYDYLIEELGGPSTPAIGFSIGLDRLMEIFKPVEQENKIDVYFASLGEEAFNEAFKIAYILRRKGIKVETHSSEKSLKNQMKLANKLNVKFVVIMGSDELKKGIIILKNMNDGEQEEVNLVELVGVLEDKIGENK